MGPPSDRGILAWDDLVKYIPPVLITTLVLLAGHTAAGAETTVSVLSSNAREIILDVTTDIPEIRTVSLDSGIYHEIHIRGAGRTGEPGMPALPCTGALVGIPFGPDPVLEVEVLETE